MRPILSRLLIPVVIASFSTVVLAQTSEDDPFKRVMTEMQAGNSAKAISALDELIKKQPDHADAYILRSNLKMTSGDVPGALADINKVIELKPDMGWAYYERALISMMGQDIVAVKRDLDLAITKGYQRDYVYELRSQIRLQEGDLRGALADLDASITLNPGNPQFYARRSSVLFELKDNDRAVKDLDYLLKWYETEPNKKVSRVPTSKPEDKPADPNAFRVAVEVETANLAPGDKEMIPIIADSYNY